LCDTCPQAVGDRRLGASSGQVSHNPKQMPPFTLPNSTPESGPTTFDVRSWPQTYPPTTAGGC